MKKEFIVLEETASNTQKIIRQWMSTDYEIEILTQNIYRHMDMTYAVTSLYKIKQKD